MRRWLVIGAALVVAVALAAATVVWRLADDPVASESGPVVKAGACPEVSQAEEDLSQLPEPAQGAPDEIAVGAERVWMCPGPGGRLDAPRDVLTTDVDDLARHINDLGTVKRDDPLVCTLDGGSVYILRFQYADGAVTDAAGELFGCGVLQVGRTWHVDGQTWTSAVEFVRLLREQRSSSEAPELTERPECTFDDETFLGAVSPAGTADEMVAAAYCVWDGEGIGGPVDHQALIPPDDLRTLLTDYAANRSVESPTLRECRAGRELVIQGLTAWGDRVQMQGQCNLISAVSVRPSPDVVNYWRPGPEAQAILDRLVEPTPTSVAACPAGPDVPLEAEAPSSEAGSIQAGASSVRLCLGPGISFQEPVDALLTGVDALADAVNDLTPLDGGAGCTDDLGVGYRLVFTYPDGTALDAVGTLYGCDTITVGGAVLGGSDIPWNAVREALREQRTTATPKGHLVGPKCRGPNLDLGSPVALPSDMTQATLCVIGDDFEATHRNRLKRDELQVLLADRAAQPDVGEPEDLTCRGDSREPVLRGITLWGDRVAISGLCGLLEDSGDFPDGRPKYWLPGPEAQALLDRLYDEAEKLRRIG